MIDPGRAFALRTLGEDGVQVREKVPQIIRSCHEKMADSQAAADMSHTGPYGYIWRKVLLEFAGVLGTLPTARKVAVPRAGYSLVSFNDSVLFPWRYARDAAVDISSRRFAVSDARDSVFALAPDRGDVRLDLEFEHPELDEEERDLVRGLEQALRQYARLIVVGYACNPSALHDIQWGEAALGADGHLTMLNAESLLTQAVPALAGVKGDGDGFAEGEAPEALLGLRDTSTP